MGDSSGKIIGSVISIVIGVIGLVVISEIVTSDLLEQTWVGNFTGLSQIAQLLPLAIVGGLIAAGVMLFRGRGEG